ncbi:EamA/RhaT family transporter [Bacteroidota bacterium]
MIYLFLCILCATALNIIFKSVEHYNGDTFHVIIINYICAAGIGFFIAYVSGPVNLIDYLPLIPVAFFMGAFFILMFYLMATSVQKAGISATTVAGRMSVILPITFSIIHYHESANTLKIIGIILALLSVVLAVYKGKVPKQQKKYVYLPIIIFFGAGTLDSIIKYVQQELLTDSLLPFFSAMIFLSALIVGLALILARRKPVIQTFSPFNLFWGFLLGVSNFGAFYLFVKALSHSGIESSVVFGINHIGIVGLSVILALQLFKEKLNRINWSGIVLAAIAIFILAKY